MCRGYHCFSSLGASWIWGGGHLGGLSSACASPRVITRLDHPACRGASSARAAARRRAGWLSRQGPCWRAREEPKKGGGGPRRGAPGGAARHGLLALARRVAPVGLCRICKVTRELQQSSKSCAALEHASVTPARLRLGNETPSAKQPSGARTREGACSARWHPMGGAAVWRVLNQWGCVQGKVAAGTHDTKWAAVWLHAVVSRAQPAGEAAGSLQGPRRGRLTTLALARRALPSRAPLINESAPQRARGGGRAAGATGPAAGGASAGAAARVCVDHNLLAGFEAWLSGGLAGRLEKRKMKRQAVVLFRSMNEAK
jgi:hypothetical protein